MTRERLIGIAVGAATVVITLLLLYALEGGSAPIPPELHSVYDRKLDRLDRRGVEAAYTSRIALLFQNWMTDTTAASGDRARKGYVNARKIYIEVMTGIDARDPEGAEKEETK